MPIIRCSLAYHRTKQGELDTFAIGVRDGVYGNAEEFPLPPTTDMDFEAAIDNYANKYGAYKQGGNAQRGPYFAAEETLMGLLDDQSAYVDSVALGNENLIWLSGFKPTKGSAGSRPAPVQLTQISLSRGSTGVLFAECEKQVGVDVYCCIMVMEEPIPDNININSAGQLFIGENSPPPPTDPENPTPPVMPMSQSDSAVIDFTKRKKKTFLGLTPGTTYYFTFFGINAAGVGQFSPQVSIVCW